jgi:hypothetical protein
MPHRPLHPGCGSMAVPRLRDEGFGVPTKRMQGWQKNIWICPWLGHGYAAASLLQRSCMPRMASLVWPHRWAQWPPMLSVSSCSPPAPMPKRNLPVAKWSRGARSVARRRGWRSGTRQMPVPSLSVVVTAEARASATKGSAMSLIEGGMAPSALPG